MIILGNIYNNGIGYGDGYGFGYGDGSEDGSGYGDGSTYGNGDGDGYGDGFGYEYGYGFGYGDGNGYGYHDYPHNLILKLNKKQFKMTKNKEIIYAILLILIILISGIILHNNKFKVAKPEEKIYFTKMIYQSTILQIGQEVTVMQIDTVENTIYITFK